MTWGELLFAIGLLVATASAFAAVAVGAIVAHPNGLGLLAVISLAVTGAGALASIWRDRF